MMVHLNPQMTIVSSLKEIADFVYTPGFQALLNELLSFPVGERPAFVESVLLSEEALKRRGISVPPHLVIQRSVFADGRPTLFCVSKAIHGMTPWHKVTITFDNEANMIAQ